MSVHHVEKRGNTPRFVGCGYGRGVNADHSRKRGPVAFRSLLSRPPAAGTAAA
jgi:hypothetical protein